MTNSIKTTKYSTIFLAAILVAGTITALFPSFVVGTAQAQPYYDDNDRMYNNYNNYDQEYPDKKYESYGYSDYGMDNDRKSYDNSYDKSQYQPYKPYKPDYKPKYQSYGEKDDRKDISNKDSKSVSINKLKCINTNININGNNTGDINLGNKGQGYLGANAYGDGEGNNGEGYYYDGQNYKNDDKGFDCIINNNNTNTNIVAGAGGNQTTAPKATLNVSKIVTCTYLVGGLTPETACGLVEDNITANQFLIEVTDDNPTPSQFPGSESGTIVILGAGNYVVLETFDAASLQTQIEKLEAELKRQAGGGGVRDYEITGPIVSFTGECIESNINFTATGTIAAGESQTCEIENHFDIGLAPLPPPGGITASNINSAGGLTYSLYSPPTIAQETEDDLSAMEKIVKLKTQWLNQLP